MRAAGTRRRAVGIASIVAILLIVQGCSGGSSSRPTLTKSPAQKELDAAWAATKATSARYRGDVSVTGKARSPIDGVFDADFAHGSGQATTTLSFANAPHAGVSMRWKDGTAYVARAAGTPSTQASIFVRNASEKPWLRVDVANAYLKLVMSPFSPPDLLAQLRGHAGNFKLETAKLGGQPVTHLHSTGSLPLIGMWSGATADLWTDSRHRLVQASVVTPDGGGFRYSLSSFGTSVTVALPPASEIATSSSPEAPQLAEQYATVSQGTTNGVAWQLQRAKSSDGRECWRWVATPGLTQVVQDRPDGARCVVPASADDDPALATQFVVDANGRGTYDALAVVLPPNVASAQLGFIGGKLESLAVTSPLVWVGSLTPAAAYLGLTLTDGTKLGCGAGAVSSPDDLGDLDASDATQLHNAPWACVNLS